MSTFGRTVGIAALFHLAALAALAALPPALAAGRVQADEVLAVEVLHEQVEPATPAPRPALTTVATSIAPPRPRSPAVRMQRPHLPSLLRGPGEDVALAAGDGAELGPLSAAPGGGAAGDGDRGALATSPAHGPLLLGHPACHRYFPFDAHVDAGAVTLEVEVAVTGDAQTVRVLEERPPRDGFGPAATTCVRALHFAPALGRDGHPLPSTAKLRLEFARRRKHGGVSSG
jgi:hypothetical protein